MFLIMGVSNGEKQLMFDQSIICSCCSHFGRLQVMVSYMFFSLFFIPIFKWSKRYYVKTTCCGAIAELDKETGHSIERGGMTALDLGTLHFSCPYGSTKRCTVCGYETSDDFLYCPKCGHPF